MRCTLRSSDGALDACDAAAASAVRPQAPANNAMTRVAAPQTPPWADAGASVFVHMDTSHLDTGASRRKARRPERRSDAGRSPVAWLLEAIGRPGDGAATWVQVSAECGEYGPGARVPLAHLPEHRRRINPAITRPVNGPRSSAAGIAGHGTGISGHLAKSSWLPIHCTRAASHPRARARVFTAKLPAGDSTSGHGRRGAGRALLSLGHGGAGPDDAPGVALSVIGMMRRTRW